MDNLNFTEWLSNIDGHEFSDNDIISMYFQHPDLKVRELAVKTGKSVGEVYRILHRHGSPNRQKNNHENVISFASSGMSINKIAEFTGYTPRNIRYILRKSSNDSTSI